MADYITIDGYGVYRPPEFTLEREDVYAGEIITCTGKLCADLVGWRYADMTLSWDALPQSMVDTLIGMSGACQLAFTDADGTTHTESVIRTSAVYMQHRDTVNGTTWGRNVEVSVRFINVH